MSQIKEPTEEQKDIINDDGNIVVTARPGSGKTFTIVEKIKIISESLYDYQGIIAISFTRKASQELELRCKNSGAKRKQSFYGTIDSFYINQIIIPFSRHITKSLVRFDIKTSVNDVAEYKPLLNIKYSLTTELETLLIRSLKQGYIFLDICGETALYLLMHIKEAQEYLIAKFTHIFIDEYQDCGGIQHKIFMFLVNLGVTGIAVGDINQAIYAFSNRYPKYLISLLTNSQFTPYEITRNHRCHKSISDYSLKLLGIDVKNTKTEKRVYKVNLNGDESDIAKLIGKYIPGIKEKYGVNKNNQIAVLCRSNSTIKRVFDNIGIPCKVFENTELDCLNAQWARFFNDFLQCYYDTNIYAVDFVEKYFNEEIEYKNYHKALILVDNIFHLAEQQLSDGIDSIIKLAKMVYPEHENSEVVGILKNILTSDEKLKSYAPAQENEVNILSLHKSKGLEYDIVFHMDLYRFIMPPYNFNEEDYEQALNLHYVGITRAKQVCYIMQGTLRHNSSGVIKSAEESEFLYINNLDSCRRNVKW